MGMHATREDALDDLLRNHVLVDLFAVVRQAMRISQPSYSIKKVEAFYMPEREAAVTDGEDSIIQFERWLDEDDPAILEAIERYNEEDCVSTWKLREWLLERRQQAIREHGVEIPWHEGGRRVRAGPRGGGGAHGDPRCAARRRAGERRPATRAG